MATACVFIMLCYCMRFFVVINLILKFIFNVLAFGYAPSYTSFVFAYVFASSRFVSFPNIIRVACVFCVLLFVVGGFFCVCLSLAL